MTPVEKKFVERLRALLVSLPYDIKVLLEAKTDADLPAEIRELAVGAVVYCLSLVDAIPDHTGLVGFADDVIAVRLVLRQLRDLGGEAAADYPNRFPEQFQTLDEDLELFRRYLGDSMGWLEQRMVPGRLRDLKFKGKRVMTYVQDEESTERLYDDLLEFTTAYEIDDDNVQRLTTGKAVLDAFQKRRQSEESRRPA